MSNRKATLSDSEIEDRESDRLVRPAPKQKPPRWDRRREHMITDREKDPDLTKDGSQHVGFSYLKDIGMKTSATRSRRERAVYSKFPPDSKSKRGGKLEVMLTGNTAKVLGKPSYEIVILEDLTDSELEKLETLFKLKTASSSIGTLRGDPLSLNSRPEGAWSDPSGDHHLQENNAMKLSSEQIKQANTMLERLDKIAGNIQANATTWGVPFKVAREIVNNIDKTADDLEKMAFGEESLHLRQLEMAFEDKGLAKAAREAVGEDVYTKAAKVLQRDLDEDYMDTFENPASPHETDADEPYMSAYDDDDSDAVSDA